MLAQFTLENFLSFKDEVTFSMISSGGDQHTDHVIEISPGKNVDLLRTASIYGANASGKSNLVKAMAFAQSLIVRGTRSSQSISFVPFKLSDSTLKKPSKFEFIIFYEDVLYSYGFKLNSSRILEEWLFATPHKKEIRYFERTTSPDNEVIVNFGPSLTGTSSKKKQFLEFVAQGTRPNQLFLTEAIQRNVKEVKPVIEWFTDVFLIITAESKYSPLEMAAHKSKSFTKFLGDFLRAAGTGIDKITTEEVPLDLEKDCPDMNNEDREEIKEEIGNLKNDEALILSASERRHLVIARGKQDQPVHVLLKTQHHGEDGSTTDFNIDEESEGTQRLIHIVPAIFGLKTGKKVLVIDELDRRLHPLLCRMVLEASLDCDKTNRSQMIFTTHDTNLLDLELLRRDEIWFVEKDTRGASNLYSLAEFKVRPDLKIQKGYLNGRFGAIPFIGDVCKLGWISSNHAGES